MANGVFRVCGAQERGKLAVQLLLLGAQSARETDYLWPGVPSYRLAMEAVRGGGERVRDGRGGEGRGVVRCMRGIRCATCRKRTA